MSEASTPDVWDQTILIIDDTPANLRLAAEHLEHEGFNITVAGDGEEALARVKLVQPDLILLDVVMPGIDGFETCRQIKAIDSLWDVPIIFMTALTNVGDKVKAFSAGGVDYVTKPFQPEELLARVKTHMMLRAMRKKAEAAERQVKAANARLLDAFEVVPEGLALFDAEDRYVLWNRRYAEIYTQSGGTIAKGMRFEETLRAGLALGQYPDAIGREEEWLAERLSRHDKHCCSHEQRLPGDRWLRIEERRTADGGSVGIRIDISDLKRREESFKLLFEGNPIPMWVCDNSSLKIIAVNDAAIDHYGYNRERFLDMSILDMRPTNDEGAVQAIVAAGGLGSAGGWSWRHMKADGTPIDVVLYSRQLSHNGRSAALIAAIDMTERKRVEDELRNTREFLDIVVGNVPTPIFVKDAKTLRYVLLNRAAEQFLGISRNDVLAKTAYEIFPEGSAEKITAHDKELLASRSQQFFDEHWLETPGNGKRNVIVKSLLVYDIRAEPQYVLKVIEDVTERKEAQARMAHMAHHDPLTDLPNRAAFNEYLTHICANAESSGEEMALLCLDIDRFKEINDVFGHGVGDTLLCRIAERLSKAAEGAFFARLGGDEFVLILTNGPQPLRALTLADRIFVAMAEQFEIAGHRIHTGVSIGVAVFPNDGTDPVTLIGNADAALYRAKADGRSTVRFFEAGMDRRLREKRALQQDLHLAVSGEQLVLHYQPQARIAGQIVGFEALVRWQHPRRGLIPPGMFIPLAEENGAIIPIGEWILREACREAASWRQPLHVAVNLSPVQFLQGDLPKLVHTALLETGLAPDRLELEITEGVLIGDYNRAVSVLRRLKALGVRIAMDDFGTGYSSLSYLQSFPFDKIKIDQTFVSNVERNAQSAAIIRAVIGLGRGLHLPVVAEGVETDEQLEFLSREACDEVQGDLIGRPRPISDYLEIVRATAKVLAISDHDGLKSNRPKRM